MIKYFFIIAFTLSIIQVRATSIYAKAHSYVDRVVELSFYTDLFTKETRQIEKTRINPQGEFGFSIDVKEPRLIHLKIEDYFTSFYVVPDANYEINIEEFDTKTAPPLARLKFLTYKMVKQDQYSFNDRIKEINSSVEQFETNNYMNILRNQSNDKFQDFEKSLKANSLYNSHPFIKQYYEYSIARIKSISRVSQRDLYEQYLKDVPVLYQNPAYVSFFNEFYGKWFKRYETKSDFFKLIAAINTNKERDSLFSFLSRNDYMMDRDVMEIVSIKELHREGVENKHYDSKSIIAILKEIEAKTSSKANKRIAQYYLRKLVRLTPGNPAPLIKIVENGNTVFDLSDYKGKFVYLDFWATWCQPCVKSMVAINKLYPQYKDKIEIVSISVDSKRKRYDKFIERNNYPWKFAYIGDNSNIKDIYDVFAMPLYYLIDTNGILIQSPAFSPSNIEPYFKQLTGSNSKEKIEVWDWNKSPQKPANKD